MAPPRRRPVVHPARDHERARHRRARTPVAAARHPARDQHVAARRSAHGRRADAAGRGDGRVGVEPGRGRARPDAGAARPRARRPAPGGARALPHRHRALRGRRAAGHDAARAPRRALVVGPPLPDAERARDRADRRVPADQRDLPAAGRAGSDWTTRRCRTPTRRCSTRCSPRRPRRSTPPSCARGGSRRSTSARARCRTPPAASRTPSGRLELRADALAERGIDPLPHYHPPAEVADAALAARLPLALVTPKTHLFLNSTFANGVRQHAAQPEPHVYLHVADAATARHRRRRRGAGRQRPRSLPVPGGRLRRRAARCGRRADGLVEPGLRRRRVTAGGDAAASHATWRGPHVQRLPRRGTTGLGPRASDVAAEGRTPGIPRLREPFREEHADVRRPSAVCVARPAGMTERRSPTAALTQAQPRGNREQATRVVRLNYRVRQLRAR